MNLREKMELLRQSHYICEDCWYSCPKSGECCNESQPKDYCNCGADEHNAIIDEILLANPSEEEPVSWNKQAKNWDFEEKLFSFFKNP